MAAWLTVIIAATVAVALMPAVVWLTVRSHYNHRTARLSPARIYRSFVGYTVFVAGVLMVIAPAGIVSLLFKGRQQWFHFIIRYCCKVYLHLIPGISFDIRGTSNIPDRPHVLVSNHQSVLDLVALLSLSSNMVFMVSDAVWRNRLLRYVVRPAGFVPVSMGIEAAEKHFHRLSDRGYSVAVFAEGTRELDSRLHRYRSGAFVIAERLHLPVVPAVIYGGCQVLPKDDVIARRGVVHIRILDAMQPTGYKELRRRTFCVSESVFKELDRRYGGCYPDAL